MSEQPQPRISKAKEIAKGILLVIAVVVALWLTFVFIAALTMTTHTRNGHSRNTPAPYSTPGR